MDRGRTLTQQQVCTLFGVTPMTLYNWRRHKGLPAHPVASESGSIRLVYYDRDEVLAWARRTGHAVKSDPIPSGSRDTAKRTRRRTPPAPRSRTDG